MRIEIAECPWRNDLSFQIRVGDLYGSATNYNLTLDELLEAVKDGIEMNWRDEDAKKRRQIKVHLCRLGGGE